MKNISSVGIVGAGTMGRRIAFGCIIRGVETRLYDVIPEAAQQAAEAIKELIKEREGNGRLEWGTLAAALPRLSLSPTLKNCVCGVDMVIENVPENVEIKRRVFSAIAPFLGPDTLVGTNTSSIRGSQLADASGRPKRFFNFNWGQPDDLRVEVMGNPQTASETIESVLAFIKKLGLIPILVKREIMGYCCNRIWRAIKKEVLFLLDGGYTTPEDIDRGWMLEWETSLAPCMMMDKIGLDVIRDIEMNYYKASGDPSDRPPKFLEDMIAQGKLGAKSGEGFYKYPNPAFKHPGWLKGED
jgi:3-hydroxybutyryl-CoA dehydrogenase